MSKVKSTQKKSNPKRFANIGLWTSGIALLATVLLLITKLLSLAKIYTIPNTTVFNWILGISAALVLLGLAVFSLLDPQRVRIFLTGRQARYGSNALIMLLAFFGILLVLNIFIFQNPGKPFDLTEDKQNSLSTETLDTLKTLPNSIQATAFYTANTSSDTALKLLENYKNHSNGKFSFTLIDPDQNPIAAQQAGITGDAKIYLQMGDRHEIVSLASEQEITSAMIRLLNPGERTIYFLTGHGERNIQDASDNAYTSVKTALVAKNYTVESLNLISETKIPDNASVIVIAGPVQPVSVNEMSLLEIYVANGGSLVILEEPSPLTQTGSSPDPLQDYLATTWGISLDNDLIIDPNINPADFAGAASYANHSITENIITKGTFYPTARSISIASDLSIQPTGLVLTSASAWGETDFSSLANGQAAFNQGMDIPGPLTIAVAVEDTTAKSHLVIFGDADFASNIFFNQYANGDMFINAIDWSAGQAQLINLNTPTAISRTMSLPSSTWLLIIAISLLCILPGLVIAGGVISWLIRRSRG